MSKKLKYFLVLLFIFASVFFTLSVSPVLGVDSEAVSKVLEVEDSLEAAYLSLLEAERVEGDVSELVALLNTALEYYSEAKRALESGEYDTVVQMTGKAIEASNVVLETTNNLMGIVGDVEEEIFRNQFFLSFGMVCLIVLFGFLSWRQFKIYYVHRVMGFTPEVIVDEP